MATQTSLLKKTKQELIDEYKQITEKYEELKVLSKTVHKPENVEVIFKAKEQTADSIMQSFSNTKKSLNNQLDELINKLNNHLGNLLNQTLNSTKKFDELQQAIELSKKNLENNYNIQISAEILENLIAEYENKKQQLEKETEQKKIEIENEILVKEREWNRKQEEYEYNTKLISKRDHEIYEEKKAKNEKEFAIRENKLKEREQELQNLRIQAEKIPEKLQKELKIKEEEISKILRVQHQDQLERVKKEWEAEKRIFEMQNQNLYAQMKKLEQELSQTRKDAELANKKSQELAVKVIEGGSGQKEWYRHEKEEKEE